VLRWVREPQQARSQDTLARLLDAAEQALEEGAWDAMSVSALAKRAQSSVGAFYARFEDKDALLQLLHERFVDESMKTAEETLDPKRWAAASLADVVKIVVTFMTAETFAHVGLHREIIRRNSVDPRFRERSAKAAAHTTKRIARLLAERRSEIVVDDVDRAADMAHRILFSVLDQQVQFSDRAPGLVTMSCERLATEIQRAMLGYLGHRPRATKRK